MKSTRSGRVWLLAGGTGALAVAVGLALWWFSPAQRQKRSDAALVAAARRGDVTAIAAALDRGANLNGRDRYGITPLMEAARGEWPEIRNPGPTDHPDAVELLIHRGADPNARTESGFVALFWAARYGHDRVVKVLIEHGADLNARDRDGMTPLRWAQTNQQAQVVALLQAAHAQD